ncbi:uncharacterized protein BDV17DRAFT_289701 [Aspergillus undulatus]|uniref:uncharacterized protein n=1 Tax=Aspergillus undulatus TaxID=1810928 RepID=UPI003CCD0DB3
MDSNHPTQESAPNQHAAWIQALSQQLPSLALRLASRHRHDHLAHGASNLTITSNNAWCSVIFGDGVRVTIRFAMPGHGGINIEKTRDEATVMKYLARTTILPIPAVFGAGTCSYGPYLVTQSVEGTLLSQRLEPTVHNPHADLERAYHCIAQVLLELSKPTFPVIGALVENSEEGNWTVSKRPLTANMTDLVEEHDIPPTAFPNRTFTSASEYFVDLATQKLQHLEDQRKQGLIDLADWKEKYIARCLFRRIAREISTEPGPFRLYCEDFSPANICVLPDSTSTSTSTSNNSNRTSPNTNADFSVSAVINWQTTYIAPNEFTTVAPWYLLFQSPEGWTQDLLHFQNEYTPHLDLFLRVLRSVENKEILKGSLHSSQRLSGKMARSLENGMLLFWFVIAARKGVVFDDVYWAFIDGVWFGELNGLEERLGLLSGEEMGVLDAVLKEGG